MHRRATIALSGAAALVIMGAASFAGPSWTPAAAQNGDGQIMTLAQRLLTPPGSASSPRLLPGQLPSDLPLSLPTPPGARVIGSLVRDLGGATFDIVLDVPGAAGAASGFFDQALPAAGWTSPPGNPQDVQGLFCKSAAGPWLGYLAVQTSDDLTDLRLHIEASTAGPCAGPAPAPDGSNAPAR